MEFPQDPPTLEYARVLRSTRTSKLGFVALISTVLTCPFLAIFINTVFRFVCFFGIGVSWIEDYLHIRITDLPILDAIIVSGGCCIVALIRIYLSRGRVKGLPMVWTALAINVFWAACVGVFCWLVAGAD
jgi:hypothetical protein